MALYAPSRTFNLAGLIGAYHIIYNDEWREKVNKEASLCPYNNRNMLSMYALIGAYRPEGYEWVAELRQVLSENVAYACEYIDKHFEGVSAARPQGTYMIFMDCAEWLSTRGKTLDELVKAGWDVGMAWQDGRCPSPRSRKHWVVWTNTYFMHKKRPDIVGSFFCKVNPCG